MRSSCQPKAATVTCLKLGYPAQSINRLELLRSSYHNRLRHVDETSFVRMSATIVKTNATDAVLSLPHVGGLYVVLCKAHMCEI